MVKSLAVNLGYRKFLVRKKTLLTLGKLLVAEGAGANFEHVQTGLKKTLSD